MVVLVVSWLLCTARIAHARDISAVCWRSSVSPDGQETRHRPKLLPPVESWAGVRRCDGDGGGGQSVRGWHWRL